MPDHPRRESRLAEAGARAICSAHGQDPDEIAPTGTICGSNNEPLPMWMFYEEDAEAALSAYREDRGGAEPFGTYVERDDGTTEFRRTGEPHSPTAQGYKWRYLYDAPPPPPTQEGGWREAMLAAKAEARRYADFYGPNTDGRNTFVMFADWCDTQSAAPQPKEGR